LHPLAFHGSGGFLLLALCGHCVASHNSAGTTQATTTEAATTSHTARSA
jgi:hypothetical protein